MTSTTLSAGEDRPVAGALWMLSSGVAFLGVNGIVKYLGTDLPAAEGAFLRYFFGIFFMAPLLRPLLRSRITARAMGYFAGRGLLHAIGVGLWFYGMARVPIAEVQAISYLSPVLVTVGAAIFLGERLAFRRIAAVVVAVMGVLVILRPGFRAIEPGHWALIAVAFSFSASFLVAKRMTEFANSALIVAMLSVWVTLWLAPLAMVDWVAPDGAQLFWLALTAGFATFGHFAMTQAFALAPVTVTQPVTFLQLPWGIAMGVVLFGEPLDLWVVVGGFMIIAAIAFMTWREAVMHRRAVTPPLGATKV